MQPFLTYRRSLAVLVALLCGAFVLRLLYLDTWPRGQHVDEAYKVVRTLSLLEGRWAAFWLGEGSTEPFHLIPRALWTAIFSADTFMSRLLTVFVGLLGVAATGALCQSVFRHHAHRRWIALLAVTLIAAMPAAVLIARQMYRANYAPLFAALSVALLWHGLDTRRTWALGAAGFLGGWAAAVYLGGFFFLPSLAVTALLTLRQWPRRGLVAFSVGLAAPLALWGLVMLAVPDALQFRTGSLRTLKVDGSLILTYWQAFSAWFHPSHHVANLVFSTGTLPLFPVWSVPLLVIGAVRALGNVRVLSLALVPLSAVWAAIITTEPWHPLRQIVHYPFTVALIAFGLVSLVAWLPLRCKHARWGLGVLGAFAVVYFATTWEAIRYKFTEDAVWLGHPNESNSLNSAFHSGLTDVTGWLTAQPDRAFYVPLDAVNHPSMAALLLAAGYVGRLWEGAALPQGTLVVPVPGYHDFPPMDVPMQYVLVHQRAIFVLPPLLRTVGEALYQRALAAGEPITGIASTHETVRLLDVTADDFLFREIPHGEPVARFGDALELVAVDLPPQVQPGERFPVITYWRLLQPTSTDYFVRLQPMSYRRTAEGLPEAAWMLRLIYPSPRWQVGQVVPLTQYVSLYDAVPEGAYQVLVGVYTLPLYRYQLVTHGVRLNETLALAGRSRVPLRDMPTPLPEAVPQGATFAGRLLLEAALVATQNDQVDVCLTWRVLDELQTDYTVFVHGLQDGRLVAQRDFQPFDGRLPISQWRANEQITLVATFSRDEFTDAPIQFDIGLYDPVSWVRAEATLDGVPLADDVWTLRR